MYVSVLSICPSVRQSVYPSICPNVYPSIRISVYACIGLSICLIYLSICLSLSLPPSSLSLCLFVRSSVRPSVFLPLPFPPKLFEFFSRRAADPTPSGNGAAAGRVPGSNTNCAEYHRIRHNTIRQNAMYYDSSSPSYSLWR